jgi:hypothetical protein
MLEARIESSKGSLYYASEATPYDLEMLRLYVRDLTPRNARDLTVEVKIDDADPATRRGDVVEPNRRDGRARRATRIFLAR